MNQKRNRLFIPLLILLMISLGTFARLTQVRTVDMLVLLSCGMLIGSILTQMFLQKTS